MTTFMKSRRVGVAVLAAVLTMAAGCNSDGSFSEAEGSSGTASAATESASESGPALQMSASLDVVGTALAPFDEPSTDVAVGVSAPVITGQQFDRSDITIGGKREGPTMLVFLAHWCPHCNDEIPELLKLRDQGDLPANLNIIGISTAVADDRDNYPPAKWIEEKGWTWPVLADTNTAEAFSAYGGSGFPFTVMLNAEGEVIERQAGSRSADQIKDWINAVLSV